MSQSATEQPWYSEQATSSGRWLSGFNGFVRTGEDVLRRGGSRILSQELAYNLSTDNGYFPIDRLCIGVSFEFSNTELSLNQGTVEQERSVSSQFFIGPAVRYYLPLTARVALAPQVVLGYLSVDNLTIVGGQEEGSSTGGLGLGLGLNAGYFLSQYVSADIRANFVVSSLTLRTDNLQDGDLVVRQWSLSVGISIFLTEFFF